MASVTKCLTLLIAVKAIEDGFASLDDMVKVSELAGTTGGSKLKAYDSNGILELNDEGEAVDFIQPGDSMPLRLLIGGMMNESGNRCSVAIGQHIADRVRGDPDDFVIMMNELVSDLDMPESLCGHPAFGMTTKVQDLITLLKEGNKHPLFIELGGLETYGIASPYSEALCGTDAEDAVKCNGPFDKFETIGSFAGRAFWKGGSLGNWFAQDQANEVPERPDVPSARTAAVGIVHRMGRAFGVALSQTGENVADSQSLFNFAIPTVFIPDHRATEAHPKPGGLQNPEAIVRIKNFAIDSITHNTGVTVIIDDFENIQIDTWIFDPEARTVTPAGKSTRTYHLLDGPTVDPPNLVDLAPVESFSSIKDFFTANLKGNNIELQYWRVGEEP